MSSLPLEKLGHNLPASGMAAASQAAVGFGVGLLVSGYMSRKLRQKLAIALLTTGTAILLPVLAGVVARISNRPESARRVRKRLESIRHDYGMGDSESDIF